MKTIEEEAKESATQSINKVFDKNGSVTRRHIMAFKKGVEFAQQWIPVEEELPESDDHSEDIEMKVDNGIVLSGYRFSDGSWMKYDEDGFGHEIRRNVTHWRPIVRK